MARYFTKDARMIEMAPQPSGISTAGLFTAGNYVAFGAEFDPPEASYSAAEFAASLGQAGARQPPLPGRRGATFSLRMPYHGLKNPFTVTTGPGAVGSDNLAPDALLLATALCGGASLSAAQWLSGEHLSVALYVAAAIVAGSSTTAWKVDGAPSATGTAGTLAGQFVASYPADSSSPSFGWAKTVTVPGGVADETITLYEACGAAPTTGRPLLGSATAYLAPVGEASSAQQMPCSFKVRSQNVNFCELLTGCYITQIDIELRFGEPAFIKFDFVAADHQFVFEGGGPVAASNAFYNLPPLNSFNFGRFTYGASGTGSASNVEAWKDLKLSIKLPAERLESAAGIQGWGTPAFGAPEVTLTGSIALDSADITDSDAAGDALLVRDFRDQVARSVCWSTGRTAGKIGSCFMPSMVHTKSPVLKGTGERGMAFYEFEMAPYLYASDGAGLAAPAPANSLLRFGWA